MERLENLERSFYILNGQDNASLLFRMNADPGYSTLDTNMFTSAAETAAEPASIRPISGSVDMCTDNIPKTFENDQGSGALCGHFITIPHVLVTDGKDRGEEILPESRSCKFRVHYHMHHHMHHFHNSEQCQQKGKWKTFQQAISSSHLDHIGSNRRRLRRSSFSEGMSYSSGSRHSPSASNPSRSSNHSDRMGCQRSSIDIGTAQKRSQVGNLSRAQSNCSSSMSTIQGEDDVDIHVHSHVHLHSHHFSNPSSSRISSRQRPQAADNKKIKGLPFDLFQSLRKVLQRNTVSIFSDNSKSNLNPDYDRILELRVRIQELRNKKDLSVGDNKKMEESMRNLRQLTRRTLL